MERVNTKTVVFLPWNSIEPEAQQQILNTASMPFVFKHVAVMPDCHYGKGATVGTVLATDGRGDSRGGGRRHRLRHDCRPHAAEARGHSESGRCPRRHRAADSDERRQEQRKALGLGGGARRDAGGAGARKRGATPDQYDKNWRLALGTLGGGNHFIELAEDTDGARVGDAAFRVARRRQQDRQPLHQGRAGAVPEEEHRSCPIATWRICPRTIASFHAYLRDLNWAQQFALHNRNEMMDRVLAEVSLAVYGDDGQQRDLELQRINSHHNFTQQETHFGHDRVGHTQGRDHGAARTTGR